MSKETFKEFVKTKPNLADYVATKEMTWQDFYELYDMYGEDESIWKKYSNKSFSNLTDIFKNLDMNSIEENIQKAEKALDFFGELTKTGNDNVASSVVPNVNRPITKFFGD